MAELRRFLENPPLPQGESEPDRGYGLINVQQRLRLYYGSRYGVTIDSREGVGTTVEITIPIQGGKHLAESVPGG